MKKMNVLGISLTDFTLKESLKAAGQYLNKGALHTISILTTQMLVEASENPEHGKWLEDMDITIPGETAILQETENAAKSRLDEVENGVFFEEFMHRAARSRKTVFLLSDTQEHLEALKNTLLSYQSRLQIAGSFLLEDITAGNDFFINEVNDVAPALIVSRLPYPYSEQLMYMDKKMLNANVWLAIPEHAIVYTKKGIRSSHLAKLFYRKLFKRRVFKYKNENME